MKAVILRERDARSELSEELESGLAKVLTDHGDEVRIVELERDRVAPCRGCFLCASEYRGACVSNDVVTDIKRETKELGLSVVLTPVVFGHYSSTVKNAVDRGVSSRTWHVVIGYGTDMDDEEKKTFIDLTAKHCGASDIVHPGMNARVDVLVTTSREDNAAICRSMKSELAAGGRP